jgi:hypothetical protein
VSEAIDFLVGRTDLRRTAFVPGRNSPETALEPGQVLVRIDRFAFTANNVTYGAVGDMIGYWKFFPAEEGWGRIPVWGFGDVVASANDAVPTGERVYGYFPISSYVVLQAGHLTPATFVDVSPHRAELPPVYNQYMRVAADPTYDRAQEAQFALFRPLFATAFLLDDFFRSNAFFGARAVVLSSASSKTALGLAFLLSSASQPCDVVGLTAAAHAGFVESTRYYSKVVGYDDVGALPRDRPAVFVDFAGNSGLVNVVHRRLGDALKYSCGVGLTHWEKMGSAGTPPGPQPVFFFAPDHARRRIEDWGASGFQSRVGEAMRRFLASTSWLRVKEERGQAAVQSVYESMLEGRADPAVGHVLSL